MASAMRKAMTTAGTTTRITSRSIGVLRDRAQRSSRSHDCGGIAEQAVIAIGSGLQALQLLVQCGRRSLCVRPRCTTLPGSEGL